MACLLLSVALIAVMAAFALAVASRHSGGQWNDAFKQVARRFHGVLHPGGWFHDPFVWIRHGDSNVRLAVSNVRGSAGERCLHMTMQQRDLEARCEIAYHETRPQLAPSHHGLSAVELEWEGFRRRWQVWTDRGDETRLLLTDGVRLAIDQLCAPMPGGLPRDLTISLSPGWLAVRKVLRFPYGRELEEFVERVCAVSDQLHLAAAAGIEFVASDQPQLLEDARCGVCGDGLAQDIVICRRCNTPHHRDCWQYGGGCATYACGGRECFVPVVAPLAEPGWNGRDISPSRPSKPR